MKQKPVWGAIQLTRLQRHVADSALMMIKCCMIVVACVAAPAATGPASWRKGSLKENLTVSNF